MNVVKELQEIFENLTYTQDILVEGYTSQSATVSQVMLQEILDICERENYEVPFSEDFNKIESKLLQVSVGGESTFDEILSNICSIKNMIYEISKYQYKYYPEII